MHEFPVTQRILEIACVSAQDVTVTHITLVMGEECGYLAESIALYFDILSKDTVCRGATLHFERVKPELACRDCGLMFHREPFKFTCPQCGGEGAPTPIGREFFVKSIEVEEPT